MTKQVASGMTFGDLDIRSTTPHFDNAAPDRARLAVNQITTYRWEFDEDVTGCVNAGIEGIGIWLRKLHDFGEERSLECIQESGLSVSTVSLAGGFTGSAGCSFRDALRYAADSVGLARRLAADAVVLVSGPRSGHTRNHARRLFVEAIKCLSDLAGESSLNLAIKPMHPSQARQWTFLNSLDQAMELVSQVDLPNVKLALNTAEMRHEQSLIERAAELAPHVAVLQLADAFNRPHTAGESTENCHLLPGEGDVPVMEIAEAFVRNGYRNHLEVEVWSDSVWASNPADVLSHSRRLFPAEVSS